MRIQIVDPDAFAAVKPEALSRYLRVNDWQVVRHVEGELTTFSKPDALGKQRLIWMPVSDHLTDYVPMVSRLIKTVAEVEEKSELQLLDDLETVAIGDILGVRTYDPINRYEHTLSLTDGQDLLARTRQMAIAAAASAVSKRPVHPRRPSTEVIQFVRNLRLGQTERGSYLFRIISPIPEPNPQLKTTELTGMPDPEPFSRRAILELIRGLNALRNAAEDNRDRGRFHFQTFLSSVPSGVSANLCEALASKSDEEWMQTGALEVSVTWSYAVMRTDKLPSEPIRFEPNLIPYIRHAAAEFRARNPEQITLNGWVNILERESRTGGPGLIRLYARVDNRVRSVRMELDEQSHNLAIDAYKTGGLVTVTGTLIIENGIYYRLESPSGFRIIEQEGLFDQEPDTTF